MIDEESLRNDQGRDGEWFIVTLVAVAMFVIGGSVGAVSMKATADLELERLRDQSRTLAADAKTCCNVAYVLNKYRETPTHCAPKPAESGPAQ